MHTSDDNGVVYGEDPDVAEKTGPGLYAILGFLALAGVLILSAGLRYWQLGFKSLWLDELFTASITSQGPWNAVLGTAADTNPPLYFVLQSLLVPYLGRSEMAMRALPLVASVLCTFVVYLIGRKVFGQVVGLWAAGLFAVAPLAVQYAQEARMYSLLMLLSSLALLAFVYLYEKPTAVRALLFGLTVALVAYTHVYGYMVAASFLLPALVLPRVRRRFGWYSAVAFGFAALLLLPWAMVVPSQVAAVRSASASGSWWGQPVDDVVTGFVDRIMKLAPSTNVIASVLFAGLLLLGLPMHLARRQQQSETGADAAQPEGIGETDFLWTLLAVSFLPVFAGLVISKYVTMVATNRNTLVALPAVCLMIAKGGSRLPRPVAVALLGALVAFSLLALPAYYADTSKGEWRTATTELLAGEPGSAIITENLVTGTQLGWYADVLGSPDALGVMRAGEGAEDPADTMLTPAGSSDEVALATYLESYDHIYVVSPEWTPGPVYAYLESTPEWELTETRDLGQPVIRIWARK